MVTPELYPCDICKRLFEFNDFRISFNRGDNTPHYYCRDCVTFEEAMVILADFDKHVMAGEPEDKN